VGKSRRAIRGHRGDVDAAAKVARLRARFTRGSISARRVVGDLLELMRARLTFPGTATAQIDADFASVVAEFDTDDEPSRDHVDALLVWATSVWPPESCPCGSDRSVRECCFTRGTDVVASGVGPLLQPPTTGIELPACYAGASKDCRGPLTREHTVSKNVLDRIGGAQGRILVSGLRDQDDLPLRPDALASKVLCERHNNALSPIDVIGGHFVEVLEEIARAAHDGRLDRLDLRRAFYGPDVERWVLKVFLGALASGAARYKGQKFQPLHPPPQLLDVLFGGIDLPIMFGLTVVSTSSFEREPVSGLASALLSWGGGPAGIAVMAWSFALVLMARPPAPGPDLGILADGCYRPKQLWLPAARNVRIDIDWPWPWDGPIAVLRAQRAKRSSTAGESPRSGA
jgi:hypothetical protein